MTVAISRRAFVAGSVTLGLGMPLAVDAQEYKVGKAAA
jgi:hypothetical protein